MPKKYDTYSDNPAEIAGKGEVSIAIRELTPDDRRKMYKTSYVKAEVFDNPDLAKDDLLYIRGNRGLFHRPEPFVMKAPEASQPWGIRIIEELGEFLIKYTPVRT